MCLFYRRILWTVVFCLCSGELLASPTRFDRLETGIKNNGLMCQTPIMPMFSSPTLPSMPPWQNGCYDM